MILQWEVVNARTSPVERYQCATSVVDNKLFVFGGWTIYFSSSVHVWWYDLQRNTWLWTFAGFIPNRAGATAIAVGRTVYLFGGSYQAKNGIVFFIEGLTAFSTIDFSNVLYNSSAQPQGRVEHAAATSMESMLE